jgi:hypothetical protein
MKRFCEESFIGQKAAVIEVTAAFIIERVLSGKPLTFQ